MPSFTYCPYLLLHSLLDASFSLTSHIQTRKVPIILKPITSYKALTITFWLMLTENVTSVTQHIFTMSLLPITNNHCNDLGVIRYIDGNNLRVYIAQLAYDMVSFQMKLICFPTLVSRANNRLKKRY